MVLLRLLLRAGLLWNNTILLHWPVWLRMASLVSTCLFVACILSVLFCVFFFSPLTELLTETHFVNTFKDGEFIIWKLQFYRLWSKNNGHWTSPCIKSCSEVCWEVHWRHGNCWGINSDIAEKWETATSFERRAEIISIVIFVLWHKRIYWICHWVCLKLKL